MVATATKPTGKAHKIAASVKAQATDSTISKLAEHTTTKTVTAPRPDGLKAGKPMTGQYLYDTLVVNDTEMTKMDIVRRLVHDVDTQSFKALLKDFVGVAKGFMDNKPGDTVAAARYKTAQNHQTVMRIAYGAIKFASDQLDQLGYDAKTTGYQTMRVMGSKALELAGYKWDGSKAEAPELKAARLEKNSEAAAIAEVMASTPKKGGESRADYLARVDKAVENVRKQQAAEAHQAAILKMAKRVRDIVGADLDAVIAELQNPTE